MIPLWLKLAYTLMVAAILPVYLVHYGPANFLWFSDIALVVTGIALWNESRLLASMMAVGVLLPELLWNVSFFSRLLAGVRVSGLADYMFDPAIPRWIRRDGACITRTRRLSTGCAARCMRVAACPA